MLIYILAFLTLSFGYSLFEKLSDKNGYISFLNHHLKTKNYGKVFWYLLVTTNTITTAFLVMGICSNLLDVNWVSLRIVFKICAVNILILLFGQRLAGDYQGAANLGVYMILAVIGWYLS
ncbi:hypothetical protein ACXGQW_06310 [Wenyingzhuangia sp. IMCC45533]